MKELFSAFKDIIKYTVVNRINTGDKTMDNLINTLFLVVLGIVFEGQMKKYYHSFREKINRYLGKEIIITDINMSSYRDEYRSKKKKYCTWLLTKDREFTDKFVSFFVDRFPKLLFTTQAEVYNMKDMKPNGEKINGETFETLVDAIKGTITPIYVYKSEICCIDWCGKNLLIGYTDELVLKKCLECINSYKIITHDNENGEDDNDGENANLPKMKIYTYTPDHGVNFKSKIFTDRTLDKITSRHKPMIKRALEDFQKTIDTGISAFNGFGTYNIGFMLYGEPGTGKTSVIKAVCNYLRRDGIIIDMKKIKTAEQLENILNGKNVSSAVFILDEFDCVQGAISRDIKEDEEKYGNRINEKGILEERRMQLLEMNTHSKDPSVLQSEISKIDKKLSNMEDRVTIQNLLTVLDGSCEIRGRCIIATTNYIDRIDPALLREGRFDYKIHLGKFNDSEIRELLKMIFAGDPDLDYLDVKKFKENEFTPVKIINMCQQYRSLIKVANNLAVV